MRWTKQRELISRHYNNNPAGKRKKKKKEVCGVQSTSLFGVDFYFSFVWMVTYLQIFHKLIMSKQNFFFFSQEAISFQKPECITEISLQDTEVTQNSQNRDASTCTSKLNGIYCKSIPTTRSGIELVKDMVVEDYTKTPC